MQEKTQLPFLDKHLVRVRFGGGKPKYVGYRINKGVCLTDYKAAYQLSEKEAHEIANEIKKYKEYNKDTTSISVVPYYEVKKIYGDIN